VNKLTLDDLNITEKKVLVRVDFNVPLDEEGNVREFMRIKAALPTIHNILDFDGIPILMSHFGRPEGKKVAKYSLLPVAHELERLLGRAIKFAPDCIGPEAEKMVAELKPGDILLLENVRYYQGEIDNDSAFAEQLAKLGDVYVNDAFGAAHRAQASICAITEFFPGCAAAGRLMMREIRIISATLVNPRHPFIGIVGGAKVKDKITTIKHLLPKVDKLLIGGAMAYTFFKARGGSVGASLVDNTYIDKVRELMETPEAAAKIVLPVDSVAAQDLEYGAERRTFPSDAIPEGWKGLDLGRDARKQFVDVVRTAATVLWNGPMGMFEREPYAPGTRVLARAMVEVTSNGGAVVVGGGDTMAALNRFNLTGPMTHISTGGGSLLEFMEGKLLPGIEALSDHPE